MSRGMAWSVVGVVGGGESSAAAQPATGGRSMQHDRRCFGWLEQEDQRLKKHYGRWMDIVRSLELESFILTKLTKHSVPVNLVGPQVSHPPRWVPTSRGSIHFLRNKEALPCCGRGPSLTSPCTVHVRWKPFLDHVDHAAPRAPGRWMTARPRKGTTRSRGRRSSGSPRREEYEGSLVRLRCEAAVIAE